MGARVADRIGWARTVLAAAPLFQKWPADAFDELCRAAQLWRFGKGETVYRAGEQVRGLYLIAQGSILNLLGYPNGKRMATTIIKPGWPFAMVPAWDGGAHTYDGVARTDCLVVIVPRPALTALLRDAPERMSVLLDMLCAQIRQDNENLIVRSLSTQRCLLAKYLAYLCRPSVFVSREDPTAVDPVAMDVTQDELAAMIAASRQTVNRLMKGLERDGVLKRRGALVEIVDFAGLLSVMEEDEPILPVWRAQICAWHERLTDRTRRETRPNRSGRVACPAAARSAE
jgi:CRP/FNR family cyclic AMP-dependent transcriptional regulator